MEVDKLSEFLFEDMIRAETSKRICRIWRQASDRHVKTNEYLKSMASVLMTGDLGINDIVTEIAKEEGVNSVEVIDRWTGDGVCIHKDWP